MTKHCIFSRSVGENFFGKITPRRYSECKRLFRGHGTAFSSSIEFRRADGSSRVESTIKREQLAEKRKQWTFILFHSGNSFYRERFVEWKMSLDLCARDVNGKRSYSTCHSCKIAAQYVIELPRRLAMKVSSVSLDTRMFFENVLLFVGVRVVSEWVFIHKIGIQCQGETYGIDIRRVMRGAWQDQRISVRRASMQLHLQNMARFLIYSHETSHIGGQGRNKAERQTSLPPSWPFYRREKSDGARSFVENSEDISVKWFS